MNRLFGQSKAKQPPPNLTDVMSNVDSRAETLEKKIEKLDTELKKYQQQMLKMKESPAKNAIKMKALRILKQKKIYESHQEQLCNQNFNIEQTNFAIQTVRDTKITVDAMKIAQKDLKSEMKKINLNQVENLQDDLADLLASTDELQDILSQNYTTPYVNEEDLENELMGLTEELDGETDYLNDNITIPSVPTSTVGESVTPAVPKPNASVNGIPLDEFGLPQI